MSFRALRLSVSTLLMLVLLVPTSGCPEPGDEADDEVGETDETEGTETGDEALAIVGTYTDEFGDTHTITEETWTNAAGVFHIEELDNTAMYLLAHNDAGNEYNPDLYSRFDWVMSGEDLYYCQSAYAAATLEDAATASADPDDLMTGCGGFAWTNLTP